MATPLIEQQKQIGRQLGNLRRNIPDFLESEENPAQASRLPALGLVGFILLGSFAFLKDIFDFVFVGMALFKSGIVATADKASLAADALALILWAFPDISYSKLGAIIANIVSWGAAGVSFVGGIFEAKTQAEGIILPFVFTNMFMIVVVAVLLLSGLGLKSYEIFLSSRFIILSFIAVIVEIIPALNIFPWMTIYIILLFILVKKELKKKQEKEQAA